MHEKRQVPERTSTEIQPQDFERGLEAGQPLEIEVVRTLEYTEQDLQDMEDDYAAFCADQKHWLQKVLDRCWDEDVPWGMFVPRTEFVGVFEDAVASAVSAAYYAGRRSASGQAEPYWQPPSATEQNQRHNNNPSAGSGGEMEEVPDGI